jgi:rubrerythrin
MRNIKMMSLRSAKYVNKPPGAYAKKPNKKKHGKKHAEETSRSQGKEAHQPRGAAPGQEISPTEAMVEDEEQEADTALMEGLEQAIHQKEAAIESYPAYVPDTTIGEDAQAGAQVAHQIARADAVTAAAEVG